MSKQVFELNNSRYRSEKTPPGCPATLFMRRLPDEMEAPFHLVGQMTDREAEGGKWTRYASFCGLLTGRKMSIRVRTTPFETRFCGQCLRQALRYDILKLVGAAS
jgi:hypothetical protein